MYDKYAWHVASGGPARHTWWVLCELPRGGREVLENKSGSTRHFREREAAQREADKLNACEHDWTTLELESLLEGDKAWTETAQSIILSHIRANQDRDLMSNVLANEAERGYDVSKMRRSS